VLNPDTNQSVPEVQHIDIKIPDVLALTPHSLPALVNFWLLRYPVEEA
jgi:hypothetical protein